MTAMPRTNAHLSAFLSRRSENMVGLAFFPKKLGKVIL
jgi:hypothetical protein